VHRPAAGAALHIVLQQAAVLHALRQHNTAQYQQHLIR